MTDEHVETRELREQAGRLMLDCGIVGMSRAHGLLQDRLEALLAERERLRARVSDYESARQAEKERADFAEDERDRLREENERLKADRGDLSDFADAGIDLQSDLCGEVHGLQARVRELESALVGLLEGHPDAMDEAELALHRESLDAEEKSSG